MGAYNKFWAALITPPVMLLIRSLIGVDFAGLGEQYGIIVQQGITMLVDAGVTAVVVYVVPNVRRVLQIETVTTIEQDDPPAGPVTVTETKSTTTEG